LVISKFYFSNLFRQNNIKDLNNLPVSFDLFAHQHTWTDFFQGPSNVFDSIRCYLSKIQVESSKLKTGFSKFGQADFDRWRQDIVAFFYDLKMMLEKSIEFIMNLKHSTDYVLVIRIYRLYQR